MVTGILLVVTVMLWYHRLVKDVLADESQEGGEILAQTHIHNRHASQGGGGDESNIGPERGNLVTDCHGLETIPGNSEGGNTADNIRASSSPLQSKESKILAIFRNGAMPTVLAKHLFSAFMWVVAPKVPQERLGSARLLEGDRFSVARFQDS
ncbi:hypothetical protein K469DRAFT_693951 [Zopfia rhizophila CBS 207.26]|uniref:Uncharacterized protein n=1 Tax=Zopfia rhizophila CBS 207.26 TaxID=1314779 RepID=A0A6A6DKE2_9PEZI|nr:hypothetical protein K469DRAFT_693951 [Zopfia rhizophila CBS 207.26]